MILSRFSIARCPHPLLCNSTGRRGKLQTIWRRLQLSIRPLVAGNSAQKTRISAGWKGSRLAGAVEGNAPAIRASIPCGRHQLDEFLAGVAMDDARARAARRHNVEMAGMLLAERLLVTLPPGIPCPG